MSKNDEPSIGNSEQNRPHLRYPVIANRGKIYTPPNRIPIINELPIIIVVKLRIVLPVVTPKSSRELVITAMTPIMYQAAILSGGYFMILIAGIAILELLELLDWLLSICVKILLIIMIINTADALTILLTELSSLK